MSLAGFVGGVSAWIGGDDECDGETREDWERLSVRIGRPAGQSAAERRKGVQGVLRVQRQTWSSSTGRECANAVLCAGKKIARGFDRSSTYHQKITARVRREISARLVRAERARGDKS